jgi:hypothetical protein
MDADVPRKFLLTAVRIVHESILTVVGIWLRSCCLTSSRHLGTKATANQSTVVGIWLSVAGLLYAVESSEIQDATYSAVPCQNDNCWRLRHRKVEG